ncbi:hypothetical protein INT47_011295, partial [Mucor saturninus]
MASNIAFEHFDPEMELGQTDEHGQPIRIRKKPGRKPNPPSAAQRKAQNRAAQRAFRERKRREMRDAETSVKRCMHARDMAIRESERLQRRLDELQYETNYLKGYVLTLKMACIANKVHIPKFWDTGVTDAIGADELTFSKTKNVPQQLEFFLDKKMNIVGLTEEDTLVSSLSATSPPSSVLSSPESSSLSSEDDDFDMNQHLATIAPQLANHLENSFLQQLLNTDLVGENHLSNCGVTDIDQVLDPKTGQPRTTTESNIPFTVSPNKKLLPPMTPIDAIRQMRSIRNLAHGTRALFTPTELQSSIRHDTRIDVVPGAALRDLMILYQDFYDANELFAYLAESSVFLGGEVGNPDAWFVPPSFYKRYWFLCPNHKYERTDKKVETMFDLGQSLIQFMTLRKQMYIQRDLYREHFPIPATAVQHVVDQVFLQRNDQDYLNDIYNTPMDDLLSMDGEDDILASDLPL